MADRCYVTMATSTGLQLLHRNVSACFAVVLQLCIVMVFSRVYCFF